MSNNKIDRKNSFINRAILVHNNKYDYSLVEYVNARLKVCIGCKIHGQFYQTPDSHLRLKTGCPQCNGGVRSNTEAFIEKSKKVHGDFYNYSLVKYINNINKVKIICPKHGEFLQSPAEHIFGYKCSKCGTEQMANNHKLTLNEFIKKANCIHDNRYDYSLVDSFLGTKFKLNIICKKHGSFMQTANSHLCGQGCPRCKVSIGESKIINFLNNNKIEFIFQKRFKECKNKRPLPFDFYLPNFNLCIEYDGKQHYHSHNRFDKSIQDLEKRLKHDNIKNVFCQKPENPNLLRISYLDFNKIEKILKENLNLYNLSFKIGF